MNYFLFFEFAILLLFLVTFIRDDHYTKEDKYLVIVGLIVTIFGTRVFIPMLVNFLNFIFW